MDEKELDQLILSLALLVIGFCFGILLAERICNEEPSVCDRIAPTVIGPR